MPRRLPVVSERRSVLVDPPEFAAPAPADARLVDAQGRAYRYLRLSVTDRCDLACIYCMPPSGESDHAMRVEQLMPDDIVAIVRAFALGGVGRVRITGGEPLVRRDVVEIVRRIRGETDVDSVVMTTNATRLAELAAPLRGAGLDGVNVSVDSLDPDRFARLTRGGDLAAVLAGVDRARQVGLSVKLNTVVVRGENEAEVGALVDYAWERAITPRFIELMPLGEGAAIHATAFVPMGEVIARLGDRLRATEPGTALDHGPARYATAADGSDRRVGFITAVSDEFCGACNRLRVNARGEMRTCLASRRAISLRAWVREGRTPQELREAIRWALGGKSAGHRFNDPEEREHEHVGMSLVGG